MESMKTWKATVRFNNGDAQVTVRAPNQHTALQMLESMYGVGRVLSNIVIQVN
jgi:hypothetical protein